jgi:hypothetical protein
LIAISLHREMEVLPYGMNNPACSFVASSCALAGTRKNDTRHSLCVFDKLSGCDACTADVVSSVHPIEFVGALGPTESCWDDRDENDDENDHETNDYTTDELLAFFNNALEVL